MKEATETTANEVVEETMFSGCQYFTSVLCGHAKKGFSPANLAQARPSSSPRGLLSWQKTRNGCVGFDGRRPKLPPTC